jgi:ABC-2 type transport system permease protein
MPCVQTASQASGTVAFPYNLNLDDLFFRYGMRLNGNLIVDLNSAFLPLNVGKMGNQPQIRLMPWPYFPLLNTFAKHPVVRNMDAVYARVCGHHRYRKSSWYP